MIKNFKSGFTHGGQFHADEVFCTALLRMIDCNFPIERQFDRLSPIPEDKDILVFDVGLGKYDHHQEDALLRPNGKKYAAVGLIFKDFWKEIGLTKEEFEYMDKNVIEKIDESDNTGNLCDFCSIIQGFNLSWEITKDTTKKELHRLQNIAFEKAVKVAKKILELSISFFRRGKFNNSIKNIEQIYSEAFILYTDNKYIESDKNLSFEYIVNKYLKDVLSIKKTQHFLEFTKRIQNLLDKHNYRAGYIYTINCFNLRNQKEKKDAKEFILSIFKNELTRSISEYLGQEEIKKILQDKKSNYIILDYYIPWVREVTSYNDKNYEGVDFVIVKNENDTYGIRGVPTNFYLKNTLRVPFCECIRGKEIEELVSYLDGLMFCHSSGHFAITDSLQSAINLVEKTCKK